MHFHVGQVVERVDTALLLDKVHQIFELDLELRDLLPRHLQLAVVYLQFLLTSLPLFPENSVILFHHFFLTRELVVHSLEVVQVLLTADKFVQRLLEALSLLLVCNVPLLLDNIMCFLQLLLLRIDLLLVSLVFFKDQLFFFLHYFLLLRYYFFDSLLDLALHLLNFICL